MYPIIEVVYVYAIEHVWVRWSISDEPQWPHCDVTESMVFGSGNYPWWSPLSVLCQVSEILCPPVSGTPFIDHFLGETMGFSTSMLLYHCFTAGEKNPQIHLVVPWHLPGGRVPITHPPLSEAALGLGPQILPIFHCDRTLESWLGFGKSSPNGRTI